MGPLLLGLAIAGGILAGIINTLAGSGSLVTLPILVLLGLPANVANGTNRVGVVIQCLVGVATFKRHGALELEHSGWYIAPTVAGAIVGALIAVDLSAQIMNIVIGVVMVVMLVLTLLNPKKWLREVSEPRQGRPPWWLLLAFFGAGAYGGFLQAGVGVMLLVALVLGARYTVVAANGVKLVIALLFTSVALALFAFNDLVEWRYGLLMGVGQSIGAWIGARYLSGHESASIWVRRLLLVIIAIGIGRFLGWPLWQALTG